MKLSNPYAKSVRNIYATTPKAVFAALAVSYATRGGDDLENAQREIIREWWILYDNGIVPQRPPQPRPADEE